MKSIRIATLGCPSDYANGLFPIIAQSLGYHLLWTKPSDANLVILGPFLDPNQKRLRWCPRPLRKSLIFGIDLLKNTKSSQIRVFHSSENFRHDVISADYSISFDLNVPSSNHFRLPYWMEMIDWTHEGIKGNTNPRYGSLLKIERLMQPLGNGFLNKPRNAAFLSSHLREPRKTLFEEVGKIIPVTGFGAYFNKDIKNHHASGFIKKELLKQFAFNLCPENSMYPGYYTEKIPEAFYSECLPISWADENIRVDFNPNAFINLAPMSWCNFNPLNELLTSDKRLEEFAQEPLLLHAPSILPFREFVGRILQDVSS